MRTDRLSGGTSRRYSGHDRQFRCQRNTVCATVKNSYLTYNKSHFLLSNCAACETLFVSDFLVSTFAAICCHLAIERERPRPVEPGADPPPRDESSRITTPPVPSFFRWVQHATWNISLVGSMVVVTVYFTSLVSAHSIAPKRLQLRRMSSADPLHRRA